MQRELKLRYSTLLTEDIVSIDKAQQALLARTEQGAMLSQALERAADKGSINEIMRTGSSIEKAFSELKAHIARYEDVKKECRTRREQYVSKAKDGIEDISLNMS